MASVFDPHLVSPCFANFLAVVLLFGACVFWLCLVWLFAYYQGISAVISFLSHQNSSS